MLLPSSSKSAHLGDNSPAWLLNTWRCPISKPGSGASTGRGDRNFGHSKRNCRKQEEKKMEEKKLKKQFSSVLELRLRR